MTLKLYNTENTEYISTTLDTKLTGNDIVIGNMWQNYGIKPILRSDKELYVQAHITNRSDNIIELDRHSIKINKGIEPTFNEVLIDTTFPVHTQVPINQEGFYKMEQPHALNMNNLNHLPTPINNTLSENNGLPFKTTQLHTITGNQNRALSRNMNMIYNPTSTNTDENHNGLDTPVLYNEVDWNVLY